MEDRHTILPTLSVIDQSGEQGDSFFAVFDGHHGSECASYTSSHFHSCLLGLRDHEEDPTALLGRAFESLDQRLTLRCEKESIKSGTTAACVYIRDSALYLGWCGDSSIGLLKEDKVVTLSRRHSPENPEEQKRIEEAGGMVVYIQGEPRVNGVLNISRSLGDIQAKPMVSSTPDVEKYELEKEDQLLYLASDGVWDMLSETEIYEATKEFIVAHPPQDYEKLAEFIAHKAKENGSSDNLTLIVVSLVDLARVWEKMSEKNSEK